MNCKRETLRDEAARKREMGGGEGGMCSVLEGI